MNFVNVCEVLAGDVIEIDGRYEHEDLAGLRLEIGVIAVAQSIETGNYMLFPNDKQNTSPYILEQKDNVQINSRV